ncbi:carbohydrate isomerase KpsF/GutQ family protein [gamma proteobacterium BDW918]|nr:carbohydrate isomerase KpsF/GutQ family protein [gamma proteobacterium BDW918]
MSLNFKTESDVLESAKVVFNIEAEGIAALADNLDQNFFVAISQLLESSGRVIVCGMGKSGIIGKKIAATFASTGTPSFFMHPGEAFHGDLGMVTPADVFIAISYSGETEEVVKLLPFLKDNGNFLISITGNAVSTLARTSDCHLDVSVKEEACPLKLAPTSSTTATLVMGDALAVTLMKARDFKPENFARFHPGGSLGRRLLSKVEHEMVADNLPIISESADIMAVIQVISRSNLGLAIVEGENDWAIITDGDLRRAVERYGKDIFDLSAKNIMSMEPLQVKAGTRVEDAIAMMERKGVSSLLVFENGELVGVFKK